NFRVSLVVRLRSDPHPAHETTRSLARAARCVARPQRTHRAAPPVAVEGCVLALFDAARARSIWIRVADRATVRTTKRRNDDLALLIRAHARKQRSRSTENFCFDACHNRAARKNFLRGAKFFPKTCCTIPANPYNYQQVTTVFAHIDSHRGNIQDVRIVARRSASYRSYRGMVAGCKW